MGALSHCLLRIKYLLFPLAEELRFALTQHRQKTSDAAMTRSISIKTRWNPFSLTKTRLACSHHTSYYVFLNTLPSSTLCYILNIPRIPRHLYSWGENPLWFNGSGWWNVVKNVVVCVHSSQWMNAFAEWGVSWENSAKPPVVQLPCNSPAPWAIIPSSRKVSWSLGLHNPSIGEIWIPLMLH